MDDGEEKVEDDPSRQALMARGRRISAQSLITAAILTALATALPL